MTAQASATEPGWLRRSVARLFAIVAVFLFPIAVGVAWSMDAVGNAYQLLGVLIAGLGVPGADPWFTQAERAADQWARKASAWVRARPGALRAWWRRRRRRASPQTVTLGRVIESSAAGGLTVAGGGTATVQRTPEAEIAILKEETAILKVKVESLNDAREQDAAEFRRQLAAQRDELRAHAVSVTRQGWRYIVSGAGCSAFGTFLALVA